MATPFLHSFRARFSSMGLHSSGMSALFAPRKPRHPLLRLAFGLAGVALLLVLLVIGVFVGAAMLVGGVLMRLMRQRGRPVADRRIVDAEYRVVQKAGQPLLR